ncbi:MAG TPA: hypothetical protein VF269_04215 [Rhodanobacteraceae bacterium]
MPREPVWRMGLHILLAVTCTLAIALALGAAWMATALSLASASWWFAIVAGIVMGYTARTWITRQRVAATVLAMLGTMLAAIYMRCLYEGLQLAAMMGMGLIDTLRTAGPGMLLLLARGSLDTRMLTAIAAGIALAGLLAWCLPAHRDATPINRQDP